MLSPDAKPLLMVNVVNHDVKPPPEIPSDTPFSTMSSIELSDARRPAMAAVDASNPVRSNVVSYTYRSGGR